MKRCGKSAPVRGVIPAAGNRHSEQGQAWDTGRPSRSSGSSPQVDRKDGWPHREILVTVSRTESRLQTDSPSTRSRAGRCPSTGFGGWLVFDCEPPHQPCNRSSQSDHDTRSGPRSGRGDVGDNRAAVAAARGHTRLDATTRAHLTSCVSEGSLPALSLARRGWTSKRCSTNPRCGHSQQTSRGARHHVARAQLRLPRSRIPGPTITQLNTHAGAVRSEVDDALHALCGFAGISGVFAGSTNALISAAATV